MKNLFKLAVISVAMLAVSACSSKVQDDVDVYAGDYQMEQGTESDSQNLSVDMPSASGTYLSQEALNNAEVNTVYFAFDSSALDDEAQAVLRSAAYMLMNSKNAGVTVEGHADERGTREYNLALGDRRAVSVKKYLVGLGVNPNLITTVSYGKERPVAMGHNEAAWAKNRRGQIVVK